MEGGINRRGWGVHAQAQHLKTESLVVRWGNSLASSSSVDLDGITSLLQSAHISLFSLDVTVLGGTGGVFPFQGRQLC